jgi:hypothetical protein
MLMLSAAKDNANPIRYFSAREREQPKLKVAVNLTGEDDERLSRIRLTTPPAGNEQYSTYQEVQLSQFQSKEEYIFVFGGFSAKGFLSTLEVLDIRRNRWSQIKNVFQAKTQGSAVVLKMNEIWLLGGRDALVSECDEVKCLRVNDMSHQSMPPLPMPLIGFSTALVTGTDSFVIAGGISQGHHLRTCYLVSPGQTSYRLQQLASMNVAREEFGLVCDPQGRHLYAIGGYNNEQ